MRSPTVLALFGSATALASAGCGGDVTASGCFQHRDLEETGRVGLELANVCDTTAHCTIKLAYECGGLVQPVIAQQFDAPGMTTTVEWVEVDCASGWSYVKRWLCREDDYPEIPDPTL